MIIDQDDTDWEILRLLQMDGRMTNSELAEKIYRSESACQRRVRRLESDGLIQGYVAVLDQKALGRPENIFVEITLTNQSEEQLDAFEAAVSVCPGVMSCYFMTGDADYLLHVVAADTAHFEQLYRSHLSRFPGVARIRSSFALRTVCKRTAYESDRSVESAS